MRNRQTPQHQREETKEGRRKETNHERRGGPSSSPVLTSDPAADHHLLCVRVLRHALGDRAHKHPANGSQMAVPSIRVWQHM